MSDIKPPSQHHVLIDGSGFLHRAKAVAPSFFRQSDGMDVGMVKLFTVMMNKFVYRVMSGKIPATHMVIFFDPSRDSSWRRDACPMYKAHRPEAEESFKAQIPIVQEYCVYAGLPWTIAPRHEADDMLAAYALDANRDGHKVTMITSDKDLMQIVRPNILLWDARSDKWFNEKLVSEKFGVPPERVGDYLALAGDVADGIPGARGIGPKKAVQILSCQKSLSEILSNPGLIEDVKLRKLVEDNIDALRLARYLVSLDIAGCPRTLSRDQIRVGDAIEFRNSFTRRTNLFKKEQF